MSSFFQPKKNNDIHDWAPPEFGLQTQVNHPLQKKLKARSLREETSNKIQNQRAYEEAIKKGYEIGTQQARQELNKKLQHFSMLIVELERFKRSFYEQVKKDCLEFIPKVCEKILLEKLKASPEVMLNIVDKALDLIDNNVSILKITGAKNVISYFNQIDPKFQTTQIILEEDENLEDFIFIIESDKQCLEFNLIESLNKLLNDSINTLIRNYHSNG